MLQSCSNPECSVQFSAAMDKCPSCGTPAPPRASSEHPAKARKVSVGQIIKTVIFSGLGAAPGCVWLYDAGSTQALIILVLGALVGFGLSLPGVSAARVAGGTVGMIVARNAPRRLRGRILEHFVCDSTEETPEPAPPIDIRKELPEFLRKKDKT